MKVILSILVTVLSLSVFGARAEIEQATVTLPYTELLDLLERVKSDEEVAEEPSKPPVDVIVQSAKYRINCVDMDAVTFDASFSVINLSDVWQHVILVEATEGIRSIDPPDARIVQVDGGMSLLLEPKESASVTLELQAGGTAHSKGAMLVLDFYAVGAAQSLLEVTHNVDPTELVVSGVVGSNPEKTLFTLSSREGPVQVKIYESEAIQPTRWNVSAEHWIRDLSGLLKVNCRVRLSATDGGLTTGAKLFLGSPAIVHSVRYLSDTAKGRESIQMTEDGPVIHIQWPHDEAAHRELLVSYAVPISIIDGAFSVPLIRASEASQQEAGCYVSQFDGFEVKPRGKEWERVERLPYWIDEGVRAESLRYLELGESDLLTLTARLLPRVETAPATVQMAQYTSSVVADGGMLHKAEVHIDHSESSEYRVKLPQSAKLLSCTMNGRTAEPLLAEDGALLFTLPGGADGNGTSRVTYVFTAKGVKMDPVEGKAQIELPRTTLFVHKLSWEVQLPSEYEATALEGNVVIEAGGSKGGIVRLSKQIFDDETPLASLYYTRRDLEN